ncbi:peptidoglycan-binding protein [Lutibacter sp. B2]|nr:peptidoglycan-binding protein [Lutibacter sp. B2]
MNSMKIGDKGTQVMEIQSLLKKIGYDPGPIDGIFGKKTEEAVKQFQKDNGLIPDGIIGKNTYKAMEPLLLGYDQYTIKQGDTIYEIAKKYYSSVKKIMTANPGLNPYNLQIGQQIIVPYSIDVVDTDINYTYEVMKRDIEGLKVRYPFLEVGIGGKSVLGRNLYYIRLGKGPNKVFYNGSHHSLEWITSVLLMKFIENFSKAYVDNTKIGDYSPRDIWEESSIYIMPMVNPDGIELVLNGLHKDNPYYNQLIEWNKGSTDFSKNWQANNRGVDLNHNYDALWEKSKEAEKEYGVFGPGPTRYSGPYPESEPESKAVADFTRNLDFRLVIAYHTQGKVIYWNFQNLASQEAKTIGQLFSKMSGYALDETYGIASYAGYKDWFIDKYRKPGYTIEVGKGTNPLPIEQFDEIYADNENVLLVASIV